MGLLNLFLTLAEHNRMQRGTLSLLLLPLLLAAVAGPAHAQPQLGDVLSQVPN